MRLFAATLDDALRRRFAAIASIFFAVITIALFGRLLWSTETVVSSILGDVPSYLLPLRIFGFESLAEGRFPLWNPQVFSGTPYAANFQTALFYPPNWLYLLLPAATATNILFALHFFLAALFASIWAHARTADALASLLGGLAFACSGGLFLHVFAGHLLVLSAAPWIPLLFLCLDAFIACDERALSPASRCTRLYLPIASVAVALGLLAGHPQPVYYAALTALLYVTLHLGRAPRKLTALVLTGSALAIGALLSAVQMMPALALTVVSSRAGGMTAAAAVEYALPPENLLTLCLPHVFGPPGGEYLGRWSLWEVSIFLGIVPLALAVHAAMTLPACRRIGVLLLVLLLLAGISTPIFHLLRSWLPGYASFRAPGRFGLLIDLFLAILAAQGLAALRRRPSRTFLATAGAIGVGMLLLAAVTVRSGGAVWHALLRRIAATGQSFAPAVLYEQPQVVTDSLRDLSFQVASGGVLLLGMVVALSAAGRRPRLAGACAGAVLAMAAVDSLSNAWRWRATAPARLPYPPQWAAAAPGEGEDTRVLTAVTTWANVAMNDRFLDAAGYDSVVLARYASYLAISQGEDPHAANFIPAITRPSPLFRALRVDRVFHLNGDLPAVSAAPSPLPRLSFVHQYQVRSELSDVYAALADPEFDPASMVILESAPVPAPSARIGQGMARVVRSAPDWLEIEATTPGPAILLITDAYAPGWRAVSTSPSPPQQRYNLLAADLALRAIPLAAGTHRFRVEYVAPLLSTGAWTSGLTLAGLTLALVVLARRALPRR